MLTLPPPAFLALPAAAFGLVMGSFVTALSYRNPRGESVAHGRSRCPACGHALGVVDLVPVLSWVAQRGACRYCKAPISWRYPAIELATMVLFVAAAFLVTDPLRLALLAAMTVVMMALAVVDLEQQRLPNSSLLVLLALSVVWRWGEDRDLLTAGLTAVTVFTIGVMLNAGFRAVTGRSGLGLGDTKLLAIAAAALPLGIALLFLTVSGVMGVVFGLAWRRTAHFPFGPAILVSYWGALAWGNPALQGVTTLLARPLSLL